MPETLLPIVRRRDLTRPLDSPEHDGNMDALEQRYDLIEAARSEVAGNTTAVGESLTELNGVITEVEGLRDEAGTSADEALGYRNAGQLAAAAAIEALGFTNTAATTANEKAGVATEKATEAAASALAASEDKATVVAAALVVSEDKGVVVSAALAVTEDKSLVAAALLATIEARDVASAAAVTSGEKSDIATDKAGEASDSAAEALDHKGAAEQAAIDAAAALAGVYTREWLFGGTEPDNGGGNDGDRYLQSNGNVWAKSEGVWVFTGINIKPSILDFIDDATPSDSTTYSSEKIESELLAAANAQEDYVNTRFNELTGAAPEALDTLHELADALGNDPDFAATVTNSLAGKVGTSDSRLSDAREWTATEVPQAEAEAGTATTLRKWSALLVRQATAAWFVVARAAAWTWSGVQTFSGGLVLTGSIDETPVTANTGTSYTITNRSLHNLTLTGNCTFTFPAAVAGRQFTVFLKQDGTGGRTASLPATVRWPGGTAPGITTTANRTTVLSFICDGTYWMGFLGGLDFNRS